MGGSSKKTKARAEEEARKAGIQGSDGNRVGIAHWEASNGAFFGRPAFGTPISGRPKRKKEYPFSHSTRFFGIWILRFVCLFVCLLLAWRDNSH